MTVLNSLLLLLLEMDQSIYAMGPVQCVQGKVRFKKVVRPAHFCVNYDLTHFISQKCVVQECLAKQTHRATRVVAAVVKTKGDPGKSMCKELGGEHQTLEFYYKGLWHETDRCYFKKDRSFMDSSSLFRLQQMAAKK